MLHLAVPLIVIASAAATAAGAQKPASAVVPAGTATLRGHVVAADTGRPLRKARVLLFLREGNERRETTTDDAGAYEFKQLRAGRYNVSASRVNYLYGIYGVGADHAVEAVELRDGQTVYGIDFTLRRGGVVTGVILDEFGEPASDVEVALERFETSQGQRRLAPATGTVITNDIGEFRLYGINPGQYYLSARWRNPAQPFLRDSAAARTAYAPIYFPGTVVESEAQRLTLRAGQVIEGIVMTLQPIKAWRVSGTVTGSDGKPLDSAMILVSSVEVSPNASRGFTAPVRPDGAFTINGLAPGSYTVRAQRGMMMPGDVPEEASTTVTVIDADVDDVRLAAVKPSTLSGRIVVDPAAAPSLPKDLTLSARPISSVGSAVIFVPPTRVGDDFAFELKSYPGSTRIALGAGFDQTVAGWAVRAIRVNGIDVTDAIEVKPNQNISGIDVELTNKLTAVAGVVKDTRGDAVKRYTAVAFAQDRNKWASPRYASSGHPGADGRFTIRGLPAGEYYIAAVDALEPGQERDAAFFERLRASATAISLNDAETKDLQLRVVVASALPAR